MINKLQTQKMRHIKDYLYESTYNNLNYTFAKNYFKKNNAFNGQVLPGCSSIMSNGALARNFDWFYDENAEFVVHTPATENLHATVGMSANIPELTDSFVKSGKDSENYNLVPFYLTDGINDSGLIITENVVPNEKGNNKTIKCQGTEKDNICLIMLPRYILDHYATAQEAADTIKKEITLYHPDKLISMGYNLHFMLTDPSGQVLLIEFSEGKMVISDITTKPFMTNFHLNDVKFNDDGSIYGPADVIDGHTPTKENLITPHSQGVERYNLINLQHNRRGYTLFDTLKDLAFTRIYLTSENPSNPFWYTEYCSNSLTVDSNPIDFEPYIKSESEKFTKRTRNDGTSQSTHSVIYNFDNNTPSMDLVVQEDFDDVHNFTLYEKPQPTPFVYSNIIVSRPENSYINFDNHLGSHVRNFAARTGSYTETYPNITEDGHPLAISSELLDVDTGQKFRWNGEKWKEETDSPTPPSPTGKVDIYYEAILGTINNYSEGSFTANVDTDVSVHYEPGTHKWCVVPQSEEEAKSFIKVLRNSVFLHNDEYTIDTENQIVTFKAQKENDIYYILYCGANVLPFDYSFDGTTQPQNIHLENLLNVDVYNLDSYSQVLIFDPSSSATWREFNIRNDNPKWLPTSVDWPESIAGTGVLAADYIGFIASGNLMEEYLTIHYGEEPAAEPEFKVVLKDNELKFYNDTDEHTDAKQLWKMENLPANPESPLSWPWYAYKDEIKSIVFDTTMKNYGGLGRVQHMLSGYSLSNLDLNNFSLQSVSDMTGFLNGTITNGSSIDWSSQIANFVTSLTNAFYDTDLAIIKLPYEMSSLVYMDYTFRGCSASDIILPTKCGALKHMEGTFSLTAKLSNLSNYQKLNVSECESFSYLFAATNLSSLNLSAWDIKHDFPDISFMFDHSNISQITCPNWTKNNVRYEDTVNVFSDSKITEITANDVSFLDTTSNAENVFKNCAALTFVDFRDTTKETLRHTTNLKSMFENCVKLKTVYFNRATVADVENCNSTFKNCTDLEKIYVHGKSTHWANATSKQNCFLDCEKLSGPYTSYADAKVSDGSYARVDELPESPGYFTVIPNTFITLNPIEALIDGSNEKRTVVIQQGSSVTFACESHEFTQHTPPYTWTPHTNDQVYQKVAIVADGKLLSKQDFTAEKRIYDWAITINVKTYSQIQIYVFGCDVIKVVEKHDKKNLLSYFDGNQSDAYWLPDLDIVTDEEKAYFFATARDEFDIEQNINPIKTILTLREGISEMPKKVIFPDWMDSKYCSSDIETGGESIDFEGMTNTGFFDPLILEW